MSENTSSHRKLPVCGTHYQITWCPLSLSTVSRKDGLHGRYGELIKLRFICPSSFINKYKHDRPILDVLGHFWTSYVAFPVYLQQYRQKLHSECLIFNVTCILYLVMLPSKILWMVQARAVNSFQTEIICFRVMVPNTSTIGALWSLWSFLGPLRLIVN